jgi:hypothetical protein
MNHTVQFFIIGIVTLIVGLLLPIVLAISRTSEEPQNSVHAESNVTSKSSISSSVQSSSSSTKTHIRIETNGKVKEYNSDQPGDVTIQSDDGSARVHVNNSGKSSTAQQNGQTDQEVDKKVSGIKNEIKNQQERIQNNAEDTVKDVQNQDFDIRAFILSQLEFLKNLF